MLKFKKHVFICINQRTDSARKSCGEEHGMMLVHEFKRLLKEKNLKTEIRAQRAGCLDACETGPTVVVYPEGVYYGNVQIGDVKEIVESHLEHDVPVERLRIRFENKSA